MNSNKSFPIITIVLIALILCFCCLCLTAGGALLATSIFSSDQTDVWTEIPQTDIWIDEPTPEVTLDPVTINLEPNQLDKAHETLDVLSQNIVPINDPIDLVSRLGGKPGVSQVLIDENAPYDVGAQQEFWVTNTDTNENFKVKATLQYVGDNIYFWIQDGVRFNESDLNELASTFDQEIIPTNREFFGLEWNPGVDGDSRFYVLYAGGLGHSLAGYFSSADELNPEAHPFSNAHEMFLLSSDNVPLNDSYIYGTMAHEFQHMIHWYQDKNEETWVNEGFSMLAEHVNEFDAGGFDWEYVSNTDMQLNDWGGAVGDNGPHYGASFLFMVYFLDRFGEDATKALVSHDENGFASLDAVFAELNIQNPTTGKIYTGNEFFADWAVANMLQDTGIENQRYDYTSYSPYSIDNTKTYYECPATITGDVYQYGVDYITLTCPGNYSLEFTGSEVVSVLPFSDTSSGEYFFWSNMGDESNMRLTRDFDLSQVSGKAELRFKTWYDLEEDYDYAYISASIDGTNWEILDSQNCTSLNPSGNSYGCGWNGQSNGWINEVIDLSQYVGQNVTVRFDYVTDAAVNGKGMAIDDIQLDAIGYSTDLETDEDGWLAEGFVRVQNTLPQSFSVSLIRGSNPPAVEQYQLAAGEKLVLDVEIGNNAEEVTLVISGTTPVTREKATYQIDIK